MSEKKRLLNDLRVIDLRMELEKRKLDKTGVRAVLLKRLSQHLKDEGLDPETALFEPLGDVRTPSKRGRTESNAEADEADNDQDEAIINVRVEDMIVQDDVGDEDDVEEEPSVPEVKAEEVPVEEPMSTEPEEKAQNRKRELDDKPDEVEAKKPCVETSIEEKQEEDIKTELNNTDAEDSINLDIGEDELLNDETDGSSKVQKEGGHDDKEPACAGKDDSEPGDTSDKGEEQVKSDGNTTSDKIEEKNEIDHKDGKPDADGNVKKEDGKEGTASTAARNLWVSGLSGDTRAKDLKLLCCKHGKVLGAKVVTNARTPGSRCYGFVMMSTAQEAENCIKNLHRTELHGRMISVEKAKAEANAPSGPRRKEEGDVKKEAEENGEDKSKEGEEKGENRAPSKDHIKTDKLINTVNKARGDRSRERKKSPRDTLSFNKIWKERDSQRARERSRLARDEERRRRQAEEELRSRERQQRDENRRLALERQKLRIERERIERDKKELLRLERERHKLEREKLELERLELKRAQLRLEEERRKRSYESSSNYRKPSSPPPPPPYERDARHKRPPPPSLSSSRSAFEAPPPPRFEIVTPAYERGADKRPERADYKRDYNPRHISSSSTKYPSNGTSADDGRPSLPLSTRPKEPTRSGYEAREVRSPRGAAYRSPPPAKPEPRAWASAARYADSAPAKEYGERAPWSGGAGKPYASSRPPASASQTWSKPGSPGDRARASGAASDTWQPSSDSRYGYESRSYSSAYQPPPPGAAPYPERYPAAPRDYRPKY